MFPDSPYFILLMPASINDVDSAVVHGMNEDAAVHDFDGGSFSFSSNGFKFYRDSSQEVM